MECTIWPGSAPQSNDWRNKSRKCEISPASLPQGWRARHKVSGYITRTESVMQPDVMPQKPKQHAIKLDNMLKAEKMSGNIKQRIISSGDASQALANSNVPYLSYTASIFFIQLIIVFLILLQQTLSFRLVKNSQPFMNMFTKIN